MIYALLKLALLRIDVSHLLRGGREIVVGGHVVRTVAVLRLLELRAAEWPA